MIKPHGASQFPIDPPERDYTPHTVQRSVDPATGERPPPNTFNVPDVAEGYQQLPMFMTADDMEQSITITADQMAGTRTPREVLGIKSLNAQQRLGRGRGSGVYDSVAAHGVGHPVQLIHTDSDIMMGDGHHRVSSAIDQMKRGQPLGLQQGDPGERFIPVIHTDRPDMSRWPGYETADIRDAIGEAHQFRNYSDNAFVQHHQFKDAQGT